MKLKWVILISIICYAIVNGLCVFVPYIPGMVIFISWGFVLPLLFVAGNWLILARKRQHFSKWWIAAVIATAGYIAMASFTVHIITEIWAVV